jgi:hypothetical protein
LKNTILAIQVEGLKYGIILLSGIIVICGVLQKWDVNGDNIK